MEGTNETEPVRADEPADLIRQDVGSLFDEGEEFARQLIEENRRLSEQISKLEASPCQPDDPGAPRLPRQLIAVLETLEEERQIASQALRKAEAQNQRLAARCVEVETEYNTLAASTSPPTSSTRPSSLKRYSTSSSRWRST